MSERLRTVPASNEPDRRSVIHALGFVCVDGDGFVSGAGGPSERWIGAERRSVSGSAVPADIGGSIAVGRTGISVELELIVVDDSLRPTPGCLVEVWHADAHGSRCCGVDLAGSGPAASAVRGAQPTDSQGIARFETIYPGWTAGRATHLHFRVCRDDGIRLASRFAFDDALSDLVHATPPYVARGPNPIATLHDRRFGAGHPLFLELSVGSRA